MRHILVYQDEGVGLEAYQELLKSLQLSSSCKGFKILGVMADDLAKDRWEKSCALLIVPGGRDIPYHEKLNGSLNDRIRAYVENGGRYLGICAGAYYASSHVLFEKGTTLEVDATRELSFFPGKAVGTIYQSKPFSYLGKSSAHAALIKCREQSLYTYYNGGCYFQEAEKYAPKVEVIARYQNAICHDVAAIVLCQVGEGKALLSGVHFEVGPKFCAQDNPLYKTLIATEKKRLLFFDQMILTLLPLS